MGGQLLGMAVIKRRGPGNFPPATFNVVPAVPSYLLPSLLAESTRQLEIVVTALLRSPERWPEMETSTRIRVAI